MCGEQSPFIGKGYPIGVPPVKGPDCRHWCGWALGYASNALNAGTIRQIPSIEGQPAQAGLFVLVVMVLTGSFHWRKDNLLNRPKRTSLWRVNGERLRGRMTAACKVRVLAAPLPTGGDTRRWWKSSEATLVLP